MSKVSKVAKNKVAELAIKQAGGAYEFWKSLVKEMGVPYLYEGGINEFGKGYVDLALTKSKKSTKHYWIYDGNRSSKTGVGYINGQWVIAKKGNGISWSNALFK